MLRIVRCQVVSDAQVKTWQGWTVRSIICVFILTFLARFVADSFKRLLGMLLLPFVDNSCQLAEPCKNVTSHSASAFKSVDPDSQQSPL